MRIVCLGTVIAVCFASFASTAAQEREADYDPRDRAQTLTRDVSLAEPQEYPAANWGNRLTLDVREAVNSFHGVNFRHRAYNNGLVGPTIRVRPGTSLHVRLENHLPPEFAGGAHGSDVNEPHGFNTTNLHTHGLHVSPRSPADNVFLEIGPGQSFEFTFDIPRNHPAGTFWYHAHKHGSTALQLASGMAGALIVEGGLDEAPGIAGIAEKVLVLQQFVYKEDPLHPNEVFVDPSELYEGTGEIHQAVNGQFVPSLTIRPGEVQRWRLIHAGISEAMTLSLPGVEMYEIAIDGLALGTRIPRDEIQLYPGYRSDILVKAPLSEGIRVLTSKVDNAAESLRGRTLVETDLLKLSVEGDLLDMSLPTEDDLAPYAPYTDADVPRDDQLAFRTELAFASTTDEQFLINGAAFDPSHINQRITLETAGEWKLVSSAGQHPFHVHVNPFAVRVEDDGTGRPRWIWRDTLFVRRNRPQSVRSWFRQYPGKTVLHCHILDHEDRGMMQTIELVDSADSPGTAAKQTSLPDTGIRTNPAATVYSTDAQPLVLGRPPSSPLLLVFHRGLACEHCAEQLGLLARQQQRFEDLGVQLLAVSQELPQSSTLEQIKSKMGIGFPLYVDPSLQAFRAFECLDSAGEALHGTLLIDRSGHVLWQAIGEQPETDIDKIVRISKRLIK